MSLRAPSSALAVSRACDGSRLGCRTSWSGTASSPQAHGARAVWLPHCRRTHRVRWRWSWRSMALSKNEEPEQGEGDGGKYQDEQEELHAFACAIMPGHEDGSPFFRLRNIAALLAEALLAAAPANLQRGTARRDVSARACRAATRLGGTTLSKRCLASGCVRLAIARRCSRVVDGRQIGGVLVAIPMCLRPGRWCAPSETPRGTAVGRGAFCSSMSTSWDSGCNTAIVW